jgi:hypothetical protein
VYSSGNDSNHIDGHTNHDSEALSIVESLYSDSDSSQSSPTNNQSEREWPADWIDSDSSDEEDEPSSAGHSGFNPLDPLGLFSNLEETKEETTYGGGFNNNPKSPDALLILHAQKRKTCSQSSPLSTPQIAAIELMARLHKSNSPLLMYDEMLTWSVNCLPQPERPLLSRKHLLSFLQERYSLEGLKPIRKKVFLPSQNKYVTVSCQNLVAEIFSKLTNPALFNPDNVLFNPLDPCAPTYNPHGDIADSNTGEVWGLGEEKYCTEPSDQLFPLDMFIDGTPISQNGTGNLNIEPVSGNFPCLRREVRVRPEAEFRLGYVRDYHAKINETEELAAETAVEQEAILQTNIMGSIQDYHAILAAIFEDLVSIQARGGLKWNWALLGDGFADGEVRLRMPVEKIRGDTVGHNKLCGVKGRRTCRYCNTPPHKLSSKSSGFKMTHMDTVMEMARSTNVGKRNEYFEQHRYHPLTENAFYRLQFCDQKGGIFQCCPGEILHQFQQGMMKYGLAGFYELKAIPAAQHRVSPLDHFHLVSPMC